MTSTEIHELADKFMHLNRADFQTFWLTVCTEWNIEDGDLDMQWFINGQGVKPSVLTVISAMHSAVASGYKAGVE